MSSKTIIISVFLFFQIACSQSLFLDRGKSGACALIGYSGTSYASSVVGIVGYSFSGKLDFQYGYGQASIDHFFSAKTTFSTQVFNMGFQLFKQDTSKKHPATIGVNIGYAWMVLDLGNNSLSAGTNNNLSASIHISRKAMFSDMFGFVVTANYTPGFITSSNISTYSIDVSLIYQLNKNIMVVGGPSLTMTDFSSAASVSAGVIYIPNGE